MSREKTMSEVIRTWNDKTDIADEFIGDMIKDIKERATKLCDIELKERFREIEKLVEDFGNKHQVDVWLEDRYKTYGTKKWESTFYSTGLNVYVLYEKKHNRDDKCKYDFYYIDIARNTDDEILDLLNFVKDEDIYIADNGKGWEQEYYEYKDLDIRVRNKERLEYDKFYVFGTRKDNNE